VSKKAVVESDVKPDPLSQAARAAVEYAETWSPANFILNRAVYGGEEIFCANLERGIWVS